MPHEDGKLYGEVNGGWFSDTVPDYCNLFETEYKGSFPSSEILIGNHTHHIIPTPSNASYVGDSENLTWTISFSGAQW